MIEATTIIADVQAEFEGGNSLSLDWDTVIRRAVENVLDNCRPETLKRRVPIYGGLAQEVYMYYCPTDVLVPSDVYSNDGTRKFSYVPPAQFYKQLKNDTYTIEYINGAQFLVIRHDTTKSSLTIDGMEAVGTKSGGSVALNERNYLVGGASIEATFTDAGVTLTDTITALDISAYLKGAVLLPSYFTTADNLASIKVRLLSSTGNYYEVTSTADSIGDYFVDGWNILKFDMANKTTVGSPVSTAITSWEIIGTTTTGTTLTIVFDKFTLQNFVPFYLEYYSNNAYISGSTGAYWQSTISNSNNDKINFNRDVAGILHYEMCLLVTQSSTFDAVDGQASKRFEGQLKRKYNAYWSNHPSSEAPLTYNKSPEIDMSIDTAFGRLQDDTVSTE